MDGDNDIYDIDWHQPVSKLAACVATCAPGCKCDGCIWSAMFQPNPRTMEDCLIELAPGFSGEINGERYHNASDKPVEVRIPANQAIVASYPPVPAINPREAVTEYDLSGSLDWSRYQASLKHKDEIITALQRENERICKALWDASDIDGSATERAEKAERERDRLIGEKAAFEAAANMYRDERYTAEAALAICQSELATAIERIKELEQAANFGNGIKKMFKAMDTPEPNQTKGGKLARALDNAGNAMRNQGLSLFDRYY